MPSQPVAADRDSEIRRLLAVGRSVLGMDVAFASRFEDGDQHFTHVDAAPGVHRPSEGFRAELDGSYCVRVLDGRLPAVLPDVADVPEARELAITSTLGIGSYIGVPMYNRTGGTLGMLCCTSADDSPQLTDVRLPILTMLAQLVAELLQEDWPDQADRRARIQRLVDGDGRRHVVQPIVDVRTGQAVGAEVLSRFSDDSLRPDQWFAEADAVGMLVPLELAAARSGLTRLPDQPGYLSVNASPQLVLTGALEELLAGVDPRRVLLEITEHAEVADYAALREALAPHRAAGLRLAIDDAGAGFASFRHILELHPDAIKVDLSLTRDLHLDPVRQALVSSLITFARSAGARLIAEGVETQQELDALARLGVTLMQGYLFSRPCDAPPPDGYPTPSPQVLINGANTLSVMLAEALRRATGVDDTARSLLDALLGLTGLEIGFVSILHENALEQRYVRSTGDLHLTEGELVPWRGSPCSIMREQGLTWTSEAQRDLVESVFARRSGIQTFLSVVLQGADGRPLGTLCGASRSPVHLSEEVVAQAELIGRLLSAELAGTPAGR